MLMLIRFSNFFHNYNFKSEHSQWQFDSSSAGAIRRWLPFIYWLIAETYGCFHFDLVVIMTHMRRDSDTIERKETRIKMADELCCGWE